MFGEMIRVNSSWIRAVGYHAGTLRVETVRGESFECYGVPADLFHRLVNADSPGGFFIRNIKGKYR